MRTTEMVLCAHYLKTSKFIPVCISIYILSLIKPLKCWPLESPTTKIFKVTAKKVLEKKVF